MYRLAAILLIPIFVVGNSFAHSHGSAAHSSEGTGRAHVHVGNALRHTASHESHNHAHGHSNHEHHQHYHDEEHGREHLNSTSAEVPVDHDSDAIYLVSVDLALNCGGCTSLETDAQVLVHTTDVSFVEVPATVRRPQADHSPPPQRLPCYLLNAALRL